MIGKPYVLNLSVMAEHILMLSIQEREIIGGVQIPYREESGETLERDLNIPALQYIVKDGKRIGVKVEDSQKGTQRFPYEEIVGEKLDTVLSDVPETYLVNGKHPMKVFRKTKPNNIRDPEVDFTYLHKIFFVCEEAFAHKKDIHIQFTVPILKEEEIVLKFNEKTTFSEAVHVNQIGYRPSDPSKKAYLSAWMGLGGGISYEDRKNFQLVTPEGKVVYEGKITENHTGELMKISDGEVSSHAPVYEMDFSDFHEVGTYKVSVPGIGCSFEFPIAEEAWEKAFRANMNALFCQRSGIVTGPPYTEFTRPRCFHPDDGKVIYQSGCSLFESGNGMNCYGTDTNNFGNLVRKATEEVVPDAWGGYFDACDWDRRIQHLKATRLQTELYLMRPEFFKDLKLPIPESGNGIADILNEGCYNIDFYKRLQLPNGGIRGGIEQEEHPILGQCGWQDTWKAYAYAPDGWSSYYYASAASRMAYALRDMDRKKSKEYGESALKAFHYAEKWREEKVREEGHKWTRRAHKGLYKERLNALADLFRLTGDGFYEKLFQELYTGGEINAAFTFAMLPENMGDPKLKAACRKEITDAADGAVKYGNELPYHLTTENPAKENMSAWHAFYTIPRDQELIRAHYLTGEEKYLKAAIASEDFNTGANPDNICFTTGLGSRSPQYILHHDSRMTGQKPPRGITVLGPQDFNHPDDAFPRLIRSDFLWPGAYAWPTVEGFLDIYRHPCVVEYTVQGSIGPKLYRFGYLAAR